MKWELKEDSAPYKFMKLNCKPEIFERRRMWLELKAENELKEEHDCVSLTFRGDESVTGLEFRVYAFREDFR